MSQGCTRDELTRSWTVVETTNCAVSTVTTVAHNLGARPNEMIATLVCMTADYNWAVNDEIFVNPNFYDGANGQRFEVGADATNVIFITGATALQIFNKTTGASAAMTTTSWKLRARVRL